MSTVTVLSQMTAADVARAAGGTILLGSPETPVRHISLDSRKMEGDDLFVPIIGERVDGHRFICQALRNGASCVVTSRHQSREEVLAAIRESAAPEAPGGSLVDPALKAAWIAVGDTRDALQAFGSYLRERISIPLVGITGSVGKTTTREMVAAALSGALRVFKTPGNSNSQVGVPITLSQIPADAEIGVIELGMSIPGEMTRIARVARVDCAVMTNIGVAHIEQLGSQENILQEKLHIQDGMAPDGVLFLNGDDELLKNVVPEGGRERVLYGFGENCDWRCEELRLENGYPVFTARHKGSGRSVPVRLRVMGRHMVSNALAALAVADRYGVPLADAARGLESFGGYQGRQQIFTCGEIQIVDDSYNASPVSMRAGIDVLCDLPSRGRRIAVLADMKELGEKAPEYHRQIGEYLAGKQVDFTVLLGELAANIAEGLQKGGKSNFICCDTLEEVNDWLAANAKAGDTILFKGSNSMGLKAAVEQMKGHAGVPLK